MDYAYRLANFGFSSLEYRRVYFDLVMCYQIVRKLVNASELFIASGNIHSNRVQATDDFYTSS